MNVLRKIKNKKIFAPAKINPETYLTPLIKRLFSRKRIFSGKISFEDMVVFDLWSKSKRTEWINVGVPFKVVESNHFTIKWGGGAFLGGANKPIIVVSDHYNPTERRTIAMHEYEEWKNHFNYKPPEGEERQSHNSAKKRDNPTVRKGIEEKNIKLRKDAGF